MNCFYHAETASVAQCKSCGRGLCMQCTSQIVNGIACKGRCEARARSIISLIDSEIEIFRAFPREDNRRKLFFGLVAVSIILYGGWQNYSATEAQRDHEGIYPGFWALYIGFFTLLLAFMPASKKSRGDVYWFTFWN